MKKIIFSIIIGLILLFIGSDDIYAMERRVMYENAVENTKRARVIDDISDDETNIKYSIYMPKVNKNKYVNKEQIPVIFAYHGIGGWKNDSSINFALYAMCKNNIISPECYIVFIQDWYNYDLNSHDIFIKNILKSYKHINIDKIYFYGFSYGSYRSIDILKLNNFRGAALNDGCPISSGSAETLASLGLKAIWACDSAEYQESYWNKVKEYGNYDDSNFFYKHVTFNGRSDHAGINGWAVAENNTQLPWKSLKGATFGLNCDEEYVGNCISWLLSK